MSYYMQGDYYRGDYYRGDPGFFSILGGIAKRAVGFIPGVGPALSAGLSTVMGGGMKPKMLTAGAGQVMAGLERSMPGVGMRRMGKVGGVLAGAGALGIALHNRKRISHALGMGGQRKHKRMNVTNVHALKRSIRRCTGFATLAKKVLRFTDPHKKTAHCSFKKPVRRKKIC